MGKRHFAMMMQTTGPMIIRMMDKWRFRRDARGGGIRRDSGGGHIMSMIP
jgi:hypothetical protein